MRLEWFGEPLDFVDGGRLGPHNGSGPVADPVTRGQLTALWHALVGERQLPLHEIAIHPYDAVSTHDRVDGVRLQPEGLRVRACDSSAREEVETPLAARMAVNHADRSRPSGLLARLLRLGRFDVGRRDAPNRHYGASHVADHASHELGGVRPELEREIATGLIRQDENACVTRRRSERAWGRIP